MVAAFNIENLSAYNPLITTISSKYKNLITPTKIEDKNYFESLLEKSSKISDSLGKAFRELDKNSKIEYITISQYNSLIRNIYKTQVIDFFYLFFKLALNQEQFIDSMLRMINILIDYLSDEKNINQIINKESNVKKKIYLSSVANIHKALFNTLKDELNKSKSTKWKIISKLPIVNVFLFSFRMRGLQKFSNALSAINIVSIRYFKAFNSEKIDKEIDQAYSELSKANIIKPSHKINNYSIYLGRLMKDK